ncbi:MAG: hypothetical protein JWL88_7 [Parcubacteria group bacterium]|nr:hypothetical protein [Parcubacteria group bacterium]
MYSRTYYSGKGGFTLIEILVVIGMIAVLASIVLIAINPLRQFALARNAQRESDVNAILNAVGERLAEDKGVFPSSSGTCTASLPNATMPIGQNASEFDLRPCLVPAYISEMPVDPTSGNNSCTDLSCAGAGHTYETGFTIAQDSSSGRITICAPNAAESAISGSSAYCLTR